ncbi:MAG: hypothetical protein ACJ747_12685 [Gaiellaceae bacterium]
MRRLVPALLIAASVPAGAGASIPRKNHGCGAGRLVASVRYSVANDVDTGARGNNWAFDAYSRVVRVWRRAPGRFCAASSYTGSFTSIAGASPSGRGTIPAGIRGAFSGSSVVTFRGTPAAPFAPTANLGLKDFRCTAGDAKGACAGTYDWLSAYFLGVRSLTYVGYAFEYRALSGGKGTWGSSLVAGRVRTHGDITSRGKAR